MPVRVIARLAPFVDGAFKVVNAGDLGGVFIKSITAGGLVTYQDSANAEQTVQLTTAGGGKFSAPGHRTRRAGLLATPTCKSMRPMSCNRSG